MEGTTGTAEEDPADLAVELTALIEHGDGPSEACTTSPKPHDDEPVVAIGLDETAGESPVLSS